ncbi:hypothetical protein LCGC14_0641640 [marine sediment metagenome]|uniref:Uncharacterized protein n=1 Tax=marine sediment metagenome TaxID=412755 RepID=A0A0F9R486_9ZZZZ|nr:hypothetical protein [archaeon]
MLPKFLTSSVDSEKLSLTIKGLLTGLIPIFLLLTQFKGVSISEIEISGIIDGIGVVIMAATALISSIATLYGLVRKIMVKLTNDKPPL